MRRRPAGRTRSRRSLFNSAGRLGRPAIFAACLAVTQPATTFGTPTVTTGNDSHGSYFLVNNGSLVFQLYDTGSFAGKITSITYNNQQMVGSKDFYYDIQGSPGIGLGAGETYTYRTGSNFVDISAEHPATATEPLDVTWHWILKDGQSGFSSYLTYHHTTAMADYGSSEQRLGAQFYNGNLFHYSSIADNFWGYQAAGDPARGQGRFITAETSDMRGVPDEYIKNYETKYDWRTTYQKSNGVTGIFGAPNTSNSTRAPLAAANNFGAWTIEDYRTYESWNAGPTHPQTPVADGASLIPSPPASHFGGPGLLYTGNMDKAFGPIYNYFNTGSDINALRGDASKYGVGGSLSASQDQFYDSLNLPYYASTAQRGTVSGNVRITDGQSMDGATVVLSTFDPTAYASSPISQEYQHRAAGYNYWVTPSKDGTFTLPDVRPGTYRVTLIKPGNYREGTFDNITVTAGATANVGRLAWTPDVSGKGVFQVGTFDRTAGEFRDGNNYNNWVSTFDSSKEFPNGVNYTVNPSNPFNDTANWRQNWALDQQNGQLDFFKVNFNLSSVPVAGSTVAFTVAVAASEFINALGFSLNGGAQEYAHFDHTANYAPSVVRSGDTTSQVLYRKVFFDVGANGALSFNGASYGSLVAGNNRLSLHIGGGAMQWDALRMDVSNPGTQSNSQWDGGTGNWSDTSHWATQPYNYTNIDKGLATLNGVANPEYPNDNSTTFADGATHTSPINSGTHTFDAVINGGTLNLDVSAGVQKLSLLAGTLNVPSGTPTLTANDALVLAGGNFNGTGTISALSTTTISFANNLSGGGKVVSAGAVTWNDGGAVTIAGAGSQWTTPGLSFGQSAASGTLSLGSGGTFSAGAGSLAVGTQGMLSVNGGTITAASVNNAGMFSSVGGNLKLTSTFTNSGIASIDGGLTASGLVNSGGFLALGGVNTYSGATTVFGGVVQFANTTSIGGNGASVTVGAGGAVAFTPGITNSTFLARLNTSSTGAMALSAVDAATALDFTSAALSPFSNMALGSVGSVTYSGVYTPANSVYRLGGGGGTLSFAPAITGGASVLIGNSGSSGAVVLNNSNSYTGATAINGGMLSVAALLNAGTNSAIGSSSNAATNLSFNGGTLMYTGAGSTTDHLFTLNAGGGTIDSSGSGSVSFSNAGAIVPGGPGNRTFFLVGSSNAANTFAPGINDPATGVTSLSKDGFGTWVLGSGAKTYSGDTNVVNGTLQFAAGAVLPSGAGKGNLYIATNGNVALNGQNLSINGLNDGPAGAITPSNPNGWATPNGPGGGTLGNSGALSTLNLGNGTLNALFSGVISGNINLVKNGPAIQTLSGDNTYTGSTIINSGTLVVGIGGTPGSYGPGDGGFRGMLGAGTITNNARLEFNRGYYTTSANFITGSGTLSQIANAELVLNPANNYTGATLIGGGIANIGLGGPNDGTGLPYTGDSSINASVLANGGAASSIGASTSAAANLVLDGGTLFCSSTGAATTNRLFTVTQNGGALYTGGALTFNAPGGAVVMSGSGDRTLSLGGDSTTASTFGLSIGDPSSGKTYLTKDRGAPWTINSTAALTYSGDTTILAGTLKLGTGAALPFGTGKGNLIFGTSTDFSSAFPAVMEMNANNLSINALTGGLATYSSVHNATGSNTLTVGNADASGTFNGFIAGGIKLTKTGLGTQVLTGTNSYTGATTVTGGTLTIDATSVITAALTATPSITVQGTATFRLISIATAGSTVAMVPDTASVKLSTTGGTPRLQLDLNGNTEVVASFFVDGQGQPGGLYSATSAPNGTTADETFFAGSGTLQVVPEPAGGGAILLMAAATLSRRRRRSQTVAR